MREHHQVIADSYDEQKRKIFDHQNKVSKIMENMVNDFEYKLEMINQCRPENVQERNQRTGWGPRGIQQYARSRKRTESERSNVSEILFESEEEQMTVRETFNENYKVFLH